MSEGRKRGRPVGSVSANGPKKYRNVTLDADVQELLVKVQDTLEAKMGFRPNLSQTIRHLAHLAVEK